MAGNYAGTSDELDTTAWSDGSHLIRITAVDTEGRTGSHGQVNYFNNYEITVDDIWVFGNSGDITVNASVPDYATAELYVGNSYVAYDDTVVDGNVSFVFNSRGFEDGGHILKVIAYDPEGTSAVNTTIWNFDNWQIGIDIASSWFNETSRELTVNATVNNAIRGELFVDDGLAVSNDTITVDSKYCNFTFTTTAYADGSHMIKIKVYDPDGISATDTTSEIFDNKDITVSIKDPSSGEKIKGSYRVNSSVNDVVRGELYVDDVLATSNNSLTDTDHCNFTLDTTAFNDGPHILKVYAYGSGGSYAIDTVSIGIDNLEIDVSIVSPSPSRTVSGVCYVNASTHDAVRAELYVAGELASLDDSISSPGDGQANFSFETSVYSDGSHILKVVSYDTGADFAIDIVTVNFDNLNTSVVIDDPVSGETISGTYVINSTVTDTVTAELYVDGSLEMKDETISGPSLNWANFSFDTSTYGDGSHILKVIAYDPWGSFSVSTVAVIFDNFIMKVTIDSPTSGDDVSGEIEVNATVSDIIRAELYVNDFLAATDDSVVGPGWVNFSVNTSGYSDGNYILKVIGYNAYGNLALDSVSVSFDNYDDVTPRLRAIAPAAEEIISGNFSFRVNATDDSGSVAVRFSIDGGSWSEEMGAVDGEMWNRAVVWNSSGSADGAHTVSFRAADPTGNEVIRTITVFVDNHSPDVCDIVSPYRGQYLEGSRVIQVRADDNVSVDTVEISLDGGNWTALGFNGRSGFYEYRLDTRRLPDGAHNLSARAMDSSRTNAPTVVPPMDIWVDNTPPSLSVNAPDNNEVVSGMVPVNVSSGDVGEFIPRVKYRVDVGEWKEMNGSEIGGWTTLWNTSGLMNGRHTLYFLSVDNASHEVSLSINVVIDNDRPLANIAAPQRREYVAGRILLKVKAYDDIGIDGVEILVFNASMNATLNSESGYYEHRLDTTLLPDGTYYMYVTVKDLSGKTFQPRPLMFHVDNDAPVLLVDSPLNGDFVSETVDFGLSVTDAFPCELDYNVDGQGWTSADSSWDTTSVKDGEHQIILRAIDPAGHSTRQSLLVIVDNAAPVCNMVTPIRNEYVEDSYVFKVLSTDRVGVDYVVINVFGDAVNASYNTRTGYWEYVYDTAGLEDKSFSLNASARDLSGKTTVTENVPFRVDNDPPLLKLTYPQNKEVLSGVVEMNFSMVDAFPGPVEYNVDGSGWTSAVLSWDTDGEKDGEHTVVVRAIDQAGHSTEQIITVIVDNNEPEIVLGSPYTNQYVTDIFTFKISAADLVGIRNVSVNVFSRSRQAIYNSETNYYEYIFDTRNIADDTYQVKAVAWDDSGRRNSTGMTDFYVDNDPPSLSLIRPLNKDTVTGAVDIEVDVYDAFLDEVRYSIDGMAWSDISKRFNSTRYPGGEHTVAIKAKDRAGQESLRTLLIYVDNTPPEVNIIRPAEDEAAQGVMELSVFAGDEMGMEALYFRVDAGKRTRIFKDPRTGLYTYMLDTGKYSDGEHLITVIGTDTAGHNVSQTISVRMDNQPPTVAVASPFINRDGDMEFVINASDPTGIRRVYINIDGKGWKEVPLTGARQDLYTFYWDEEEMTAGDHVYEVKVVDNMGNEEIYPGVFSSDKEVRKDYIASFNKLLPMVIFGLVLILLIFTLFVLVRKGYVRRMLEKPGKEGKVGKEEEKVSGGGEKVGKGGWVDEGWDIGESDKDEKRGKEEKKREKGGRRKDPRKKRRGKGRKEKKGKRKKRRKGRGRDGREGKVKKRSTREKERIYGGTDEEGLEEEYVAAGEESGDEPAGDEEGYEDGYEGDEEGYEDEYEEDEEGYEDGYEGDEEGYVDEYGEGGGEHEDEYSHEWDFERKSYTGSAGSPSAERGGVEWKAEEEGAVDVRVEKGGGRYAGGEEDIPFWTPVYTPITETDGSDNELTASGTMDKGGKERPRKKVNEEGSGEVAPESAGTFDIDANNDWNNMYV